MSEAANQVEREHRRWAAPGGSHDKLVGFLGWLLPTVVGVLAAILIMAPMWMRGETSFVLQKNGLDQAQDRLRVTEAAYRGEDAEGRPFLLQGKSAVQKSSTDPVVELNGLTGQIALRDGIASIDSERGFFNMKNNDVSFPGTVLMSIGDKYQLTTSDISVDLKGKRGYSDGPVKGSMPLGQFSANRMTMDMESRIIILEGRARVHVKQGALKK